MRVHGQRQRARWAVGPRGSSRLRRLIPGPIRRVGGALALGLAFLTHLAVAAPQVSAVSNRWWKGNLHTHTFWSDGDDFPEMVVSWYKRHGYHFLALSDHNTLQEGERWLTIGNPRTADALRKYLARFGPDWVEQRITEDYHKVRLKTLAEFRGEFEEPGRFLLIPSEEITDAFAHSSGRVPVHVNATHLRALIKPAGGASVLDVLQRNINAVLAQRRSTGQPMIPHIAHPNFGWAITAEDLMRVQGERFFEVYNGHPAVHNEGGAD